MTTRSSPAATRAMSRSIILYVRSGRIAISAPLARALIGREEGDTVTLKTGKGSREYQISEVHFEPQK